ncbi:MAG: hypothetical protein GXP53_13630 [Deltaproteobacteria bacterium]|nr:hypothetical protein [Deltaproteobacteria bacterium]
MLTRRETIAFNGLAAVLMILLSAGFIGCAKHTPGLQAVSWTKSSGTISSGKYRCVIVADLDNDARKDIVAGSYEPGNAAIWYGDGAGNLTTPFFLPFKADVHSIAAGDLNGDGRSDLVMSVQREASGIMVWMNEGGRNWERGIVPVEVHNYEGIRLADVNNDGYSDIVAANGTSEDSGGIQVWLGDGRGGWRAEVGPTVNGRYMDVEVGDFNDDGNIDIAGASWGAYGAVRVWLGDGTGNWSPMAPVCAGNFYGLSRCDINGDGKTDLLAGTYKKGIIILTSRGGGAFDVSSGPVDTGSFWKVIGTDLNSDKVVDIVSGSVDGHGISAWLNREKDGWEEAEGVFPTIGNDYDLVAADLDGDGHDELVYAGYGEGVKIMSGSSIPFAGRSFLSVVDSLSGDKTDTNRDVTENSIFTSENGFIEYKVGPRDTLEITMWEPDKVTKQEVEIMADGTLSFSFVQDLPVKGMTLREIDKELTRYLKDYIKDPRIDVRVSYYMSKKVSIMGPGRSHQSGGGYGAGGNRGGNTGFYLEGKVSLVEMLSRTHSARPDANLREVKVRRKNGRTLKLNLYKAMTMGDKTQDIILDDGDVIYLPLISKEGNRVFIFGEVNQPGVYSFTGSQMQMFDAISAAGGPTIFAKPQYARIVRGDIANPEIIPVNLQKLIETGDQSQNLSLKDGDLLFVPRSAIGDVNQFVSRIRPIVELAILPGYNIQYLPVNGSYNRTR